MKRFMWLGAAVVVVLGIIAGTVAFELLVAGYFLSL